MSTKDALRAAATKSKPQKRAKFEYNGETFELAACTVQERTAIIDKVTKNGVLDNVALTIQLFIKTTVVPGTDEKIFNEADVEMFMNGYDMDFFDAASEAMKQLFGDDSKK